MKRFLRIEFAVLVLILLIGAGALYFHGNSGSNEQARASLKKHIAGDIIARAQSANGRVLASAALDGTIQLYDEKGRPSGVALPPPAETNTTNGRRTLTALALSAGGEKVLSAYSDGEIIERNAGGGGLKRIRAAGGEPASALLALRDDIVIGNENGEILLLSRDTEKTTAFPSGNRVGAVRILVSNGSKLAAAGDDDLVSVHEIPSRKLMAAPRVTGAPIASLAFDDAGRRLFIATEGDGLRVYGPGPEKLFTLLARGARGRGLLSIAHGKDTLAAGTRDGPVLLFDLPKDALAKSTSGRTPELRPARILRGHLEGAVLLAFNDEGLLSAARDDSIRRWRLDGTPIDPPYLGHPDRVRHLVFASGGNVVGAALGGNGVENAVWLWSPGGKLLARHRGHEQDVDCLVISRDGRKLASGSSDNTIRLTSLGKDGKAAGTVRVLKDHDRRITRLDFSPDGRYLLSASGDGTIRLRNPDTGRVLSVLRGHRGTVTRARFSDDGRFILSGGGDRTLRLWPVTPAGDADKRPVGEAKVFKGHTLGITAAAVSPRGELIASAAWDRTVRLTNVKAGTGRGIQLPERQWIISLAFHPTRKIIAGGGWDGGLRFWDYQGRELARIADIHGGRVSALAFSPDGKVLATSSYDRVVRLHELKDMLP